MRLHTKLPKLAFSALALLLLQNPFARTVEPTETPGVEVLTRGPVHEGFAQPADNQPQAGPVAPKEPPAAIEELPPDQKPEGDNVDWMPGYWQWDDGRNDFVWVSGFWRTPPPGRKWVPGNYAKTDNGYQWVPGFWAPTEQRDLPYQPPPPPSIEDGPSTPAPSDNAIYNSGTWVYQDQRYRWRPGFYLDYRPGWVWNPAHYVWTPAGYLFVDGYWDYPLADRGLLFAPAYIDPLVCSQPGFVYRPWCAFRPDLLTSALFIRPSWCHYYVGDYFGDTYRRAGFAAFSDYRFGRGAGYDPLYSYYRAANRGGSWERDTRATYAQERSSRALALTTPLSRPTNLGVRLTTVTSQQITATRQTVTQVRDVTRQRQTLEAQAARTQGAVRTNDPPRLVTLNAPKTAFVAERKAVVAPPTPTHVTTATRRESAVTPNTRTEVSPGVFRRDTPKFETPLPKKETTITPPTIRHDTVTTPKSATTNTPPTIRHDTVTTPKPATTTPPVIRHDTVTTPPVKAATPPPVKAATPPPVKAATTPPVRTALKAASPPVKAATTPPVRTAPKLAVAAPPKVKVTTPPTAKTAAKVAAAPRQVQRATAAPSRPTTPKPKGR